MNKYIAIVDFKAATGKGLGYHDLNAKSLLDAMAEAESLNADNVYRLSIAEKFGKSERREGAKRTAYKEILAQRSCGWHACDNEHCENSAVFERADYGAFVDYQVKLV